MKHPNKFTSRRSFLSTAMGLTAAVAVGDLSLRDAHAAGHMARVSPDDPTAKSLAYVEQSTKEGQWCLNCQLYTGKDGDAYGPCAIFPGKEVAAKGWCKSWVKKAG